MVPVATAALLSFVMVIRLSLGNDRGLVHYREKFTVALVYLHSTKVLLSPKPDRSLGVAYLSHMTLTLHNVVVEAE